MNRQCPHGFEWLAPVRFQDGQVLHEHAAPALFKGLAQSWPAVRQWRFSHLAQHVSDRPVRLVEGDRERGATRFVDATLHAYLHSLEEGGRQDAAPLYLKEFDLLKAAPALHKDLHHAALLGPGKLSSLQSWIGPARAHTGLHYDYLDNLAVQIIGRKRFYLARPGVVEAMGALSSKYDAWARLSSTSAQELASSVGGATRDFFVVDLEPGDVLHVPAGWWHQVDNLTPALLLGGFYGPHAKVLARWAWVGARETLHRCGWLGRGHCTCHTPGEADKARRPPR